MTIASFAVLAGLLTIVPGLDTALVLRSAAVRGRSHAFATAFGISTGALLWGAAAAGGATALLTVSHIAYTSLRVAGAAYLLWMGAGLLKALRREPALAVDPRPQAARLSGSYRRGLTTNLLNPKIGVFYTAMLPRFIPAHTPHLAVGCCGVSGSSGERCTARWTRSPERSSSPSGWSSLYPNTDQLVGSRPGGPPIAIRAPRVILRHGR